MNSQKLTAQLMAFLTITVFILAACGAPAAPAAPSAGEETAPVAAADASGSAAVGGAILNDKPAEAGEREVQTEVYNSPAEAGTISEYHEAPELAEQVNSGDLPPIDERLPLNPIVVKPEESIGKYGGVLRKTVTGQRTLAEMGWWLVEPLTLHSPKGEIIPNVAEGWEWNDDYTQLTLNLRKGIHWSDGEPFTASDILFWWEDIILNEELTPSPPTLLSRGDELAELARML